MHWRGGGPDDRESEQVSQAVVAAEHGVQHTGVGAIAELLLSAVLRHPTKFCLIGDARHDPEIQ